MISAAVKTYEAKKLAEVVDYPFELTDLIIWASIEFNLLIICASAPILRTLFQRRRPKHIYSTEGVMQEEHELSTKESNDDKGGGKSAISSVNGSQENIVPQRPRTTALSAMDGINRTRTVEVQVSFEHVEAPKVHAALVGLMQGEELNPHLAKR